MSNFNNVVLAGRITKDPDLKYTTEGKGVCNFTLAINDYWLDKAGKKQETTTFVDCECWGKIAENTAEYMKKGSGLILGGRLKLDRWEKDGQKRSKLKVVATTVKFFPKVTQPKQPNIPAEEEQAGPSTSPIA